MRASSPARFDHSDSSATSPPINAIARHCSGPSTPSLGSEKVEAGNSLCVVQRHRLSDRPGVVGRPSVGWVCHPVGRTDEKQPPGARRESQRRSISTDGGSSGLPRKWKSSCPGLCALTMFVLHCDGALGPEPFHRLQSRTSASRPGTTMSRELDTNQEA